jgi:uncharacterized protein YdeI (YjbR/CyaY-like superfamily)
MKQIYFKDPNEWRNWLSHNWDKKKEIWLIFYKKETGKPSIDYNIVVEEALCFGWIDSIIKKIDNQRFVRKFTSRKDNSNWSESNKRRVVKLIEENRMTGSGLAKIKIAKKNGQWFKPDKPEIDIKIHSEFLKALDENVEARKFFDQLPQTNKNQFNIWINAAKQSGSKNKRILESIRLLAARQKLGLK